MTRDDAPGADDRDRELLDELRGVVTEIDPVPPEVTAFAKAAFGWRRVDAELAELLADSALDAEALTGVRGTARSRAVTFEAAELTIEVEIEAVDAGLVLLGQLAPPRAAAVEVQRDDGSVAAATEADTLGRFRIELAAGGRIRLRVVSGGAVVETSWLSL